MKKIFLLVAVTLFGLASCDLTEEPVTANDTDKALGTFEGLNDATAFIYSAFRSEGWYGSYTSLMPDVMCGNAVAGQPLNTGRGNSFNNWLFTASSGWTIWGNAYTNLLRCNNVIYKIKTDRATYLAEDGVTDESLDNIMAECLFVRAYCYFDLVRWYSVDYDPATASTALGVPIVSEDPSVSVVEKPKRKTLAEVYAAIVQDLNDALGLMSETYIHAGVTDTKATCTYHVIEALLARVYLYMHDYENAELMATNVITSGDYTLATQSNYASIWSEAVWSNNGEIIFGVYSSLSEGSVSNSNGMVTSPDEYGDVRVSNDLLDILSQNDVRRTMLQTSSSYSGYYWPAKYMGKGDGTSVAYSNIPLIRTSEMYLIRAEARYRLNKDGALSDLNAVATNRGATAYDAVTEDAIFNENRKEFAFEGHIYHDYKRFDRRLVRTDVISGTSNQNVERNGDGGNGYLWLMPIATSELEVNENLEQNPGY